MKKKLEVFLCISISFNVLISSVVLYRHRAGIKKRVEYILLSNNQKKIEKDSLDMNEQVFEPVYDSLDIGADRTVRIAFVGNSITLHDATTSIGWTHTSGMAASNLENDYVHKTVYRIAKEKQINVDYSVINIADWEREFETFSFTRIEGVNEFKPDYTVYQLGENVLQSDVEQKFDSFVKHYTDLITFIESNNDEIVCIPFWYSKEKAEAITKVALLSKSYLVDLSHLGNGLDKRNYANSEVKYKHPGVAVHPGDFGMEKISDNIYSILNVVIE